ncbi:MAG: zinc metallopeptidase [Thermoanaerobaculaceae bacterium]|nr:zinc metallopeptidase [Thermoanaerobaculaceae bacterium]MDI9621863.1 neutral zinc metallopeptidase [Acidobacteriota bacterium]NLH11037.1 zinc metallopeptidase [Holophagae bacterium]
MRWRRGESRQDIEDLRGQGAAWVRLGGGRVRLGCGGILVLLVLSLLFKRNLFTLLDLGPVADVSGTGGMQTQPYRSSAAEEEKVDFVTFVLNDAQRVWAQHFASSGRQYQNTKLVLFTDAVGSACGYAQSASGPFYCPGDSKVYIDLAFYDELRHRFGASGDMAQAYVIAHEIGHHVQHLLGIDAEVRRLQQQRPSLANDLSVRLELQADCFAGIWAHSTARRDLLERGDLAQALGAAAAIGDDRLQRQAGQRVNPDTFTHGSSAQRVEWFRRGFESGDVRQCDTFRTSGR